VECDLIDAQLFAKSGEQPDQRLTDRACAHDVNDSLMLHGGHSWLAWI
jgi:hypothetical protein